jgi:Uma2 family endonuclease
MILPGSGKEGTMIAAPKSASRRTREIPPLQNGDHLDQKTFHERYEAMPPNTRAELIGGIVYMSSPMKPPHGLYSSPLYRWLDEYVEATPGTESMPGVTSVLGPQSEPQADGCLVILPEYGGQTWEESRGYLAGPPEWLGEISDSTESIDLHTKKEDYEKAGVREYTVIALRQKKVLWFIRRRGKFKELSSDSDGIFRSEVFPGLWLDPAAFLRRDRKQMLAVLRQGLASPAHAAFVAKLTKKRRQ